MFCYIFRLSYSKNKQTKMTCREQLRHCIPVGIIWIWSGTRDQESTNHRAHFVDWKSSYITLYNNPSYSRILIGSCLWSIRGQTHDWRHHYRVFACAILKWRKVLRIRIIFHVTGQKIRYKKVLPRHWTGSRSQKSKEKVVSFRKWYRNNFLAASVGSRSRLNHAQTWSW